MRLHRLTDSGIEDFGRFLDALTTDSPAPYPAELLSKSDASEAIEPAVDLAHRPFASRFEAAQYLHDVLSQTQLRAPENDRGLWSWLALFYFEPLCPPDKKGRRRPGERVRWIPVVGDFRRYHRHLLAGPYRVFMAHRDEPERTMALMCGPVHEISDVYRELAGRQELITNPGVIEAATRLYYDPVKKRLKRIGTRGSPGTIRRFAEVLMQLDVAWDLYSMSAEEIIGILPAEFDRFRR